MNILVDTNILIPLEDTNQPLSNDLAEMKRLCSEMNWKLLLHPAQFEDIARDKNENRRKIMKSRLAQYSQLSSPPTVKKDWLEQNNIKQDNDNDRVDNALLFALYRGAVNYLLTEDRDIHRKAFKLGCSEYIIRLSQLLSILRKKLSLNRSWTPAGLMDQFLYEIEVKQPFFDSLRDSYEIFDEWYKKSAIARRKAWCITKGSELSAICIYKKETDSVINDDGDRLSSALKLCTFKVAPDARGQKYGERLLYSAFKFAHENNLSYVYLHARGKEHELLVSLCEEYGFIRDGRYQGDDVLIKDMNKPNESTLSALQYSIKHYPYFKVDQDTSCYVIPIIPRYHETLFPDISDTSRGLFRDHSEMYSTPSHTIKKAYVCHANIRKIKAGDIVLFYRSHDRRNIQVIGIVEQSVVSKDREEIIALTSKRTVFTEDELSSFSQKNCLIILFRLQQILKKEALLNNSIIRGSIQSIREISWEKFFDENKEVINW